MHTKAKALADVHCWVISLARQPERREAMRSAASEHGLDVEFFDAVDMKEHTRADLAERCSEKGPWGILREHDLACTLSHLDALEKFLDTNKSFCLIMEDDVVISPDLSSWIRNMDWWPSDANIVKIERWRKEGTWIVVGRADRSYGGRSIRRLHSRHMGAAGYIVDRGTARMIIDHRPRNLPIDHLLFNFCASALAKRMVVYQVEPALVRQIVNGKAVKRTIKVPHKQLRNLTSREAGLSYIKREVRRGLLEISMLPYWTKEVLIGGGAVIQPTFE